MENTFNGKTALAYCRELTKNGEKLAMIWDGGNDEGYINIFLNDQCLSETDDVQLHRLHIYLENNLGYGSFAGNFFAEGRCEFDHEDGCFIGTGTYTEEKADTEFCDFELQVPSDFWFDAIQVSIQGRYETPTVEIDFEIRNGPTPTSYDQWRKRLQTQLTKELNKFTAEFDADVALWERMRIPRNEFDEKDGFLTHVITEMPYAYHDTEEELVIIDF